MKLFCKNMEHAPSKLSSNAFPEPRRRSCNNLTESPKFNFEILCQQVSPHFIMKAPGSRNKPYHTIPCQAKPAMPWLEETRQASARAGVVGGAMAVWVCGGSGPKQKLQRVGPKVPLYESTRTAYPTTTQQPENSTNVAYQIETFLQKYGTCPF